MSGDASAASVSASRIRVADDAPAIRGTDRIVAVHCALGSDDANTRHVDPLSALPTGRLVLIGKLGNRISPAGNPRSRRERCLGEVGEGGASPRSRFLTSIIAR